MFQNWLVLHQNFIVSTKIPLVCSFLVQSIFLNGSGSLGLGFGSGSGPDRVYFREGILPPKYTY